MGRFGLGVKARGFSLGQIFAEVVGQDERILIGMLKFGVVSLEAIIWRLRRKYLQIILGDQLGCIDPLSQLVLKIFDLPMQLVILFHIFLFGGVSQDH